MNGAGEPVTTYYIDESGDLGFRRNSTAFFIVSVVKTPDPTHVERIFRRFVGRRLRRTLFGGEFHFSRLSDSQRKGVLTSLLRAEWETTVFVFDKRVILERLRPNPDELYDLIISDTVLPAILSDREKGLPLLLCFDKRFKARKQGEFNALLGEKLAGILGEEALFTKFSVTHSFSHDERGIQLADLVAGAVFQKYEKGNSTYFSVDRGENPLGSPVEWLACLPYML